MMCRLKYCVGVLVLLLLSSCFPEQKQDLLTHLPFLNRAEGKWGLVTTGGMVVLDEQFSGEPTPAYRNIFIMSDSAGLLEYYKLDSGIEKIGKRYRYAGHFVNELAPVAEPDSVIKLINTQGEEVLRLERIQGQEVEAVCAYGDGVFIYQNSSRACGCIDESGKSIIPAEYESLRLLGDGYILAVLPGTSASEPQAYHVFNIRGERVGEISMNDYDEISSDLIDGKYFYVRKYIDNLPQCGLVGINGEVKMPLNPEVFQIKSHDGANFVYSDGTYYGVMNVEGETLIPAGYSILYFMGANRLLAFDEYHSGKIIDLENRKVGEYEAIAPLFPESRYVNGVAPVALADTIWAFLDYDGNETASKRFYRISSSDESPRVYNDYFDLNEALSRLGVHAYGVGNLNFSSCSEEVSACHGHEWPIYPNSTEVGFEQEYRGHLFDIQIFMSGQIQKKDTLIGNWVFSRETPLCFRISLDISLIPEYKRKEYWQGFVKTVTLWGNECIEADETHVVYKTGKDTYAVARHMLSEYSIYLCKESYLNRILAGWQ